MLIAHTSRQVAHHRFETAPRRGVIDFLLLHRIEDTDRIIERYPVASVAGGALLLFGLWFVLLCILGMVFA